MVIALTSLGEYLGLEVLKASIPLLGVNVSTYLACLSKWTSQLLSLLGNAMAAAVSPRAVGSVDHAATAALAAYSVRARGAGVARKPGLEIVLALTGQRNIKAALKLAEPVEGESAVLIAIGDADVKDVVDTAIERVGLGSCRLDPVGACRLILGLPCIESREARRLLVTLAALYPITSRLTPKL